MGIIAADPETAQTYREYFLEDDSIRCVTMREAQGVEFDIVCLVGWGESEPEPADADPSFLAARARMRRDLLYVAMTRAMSQLHVIGRF